MNLNQITLPVNNMDEATAFYLKLGFTQIVDTLHYARFESPVGGASFSLALMTDDFSNGAVIYFENRELDRWVSDLKKIGIAFDQEPTDQLLFSSLGMALYAKTTSRNW